MDNSRNTTEQPILKAENIHKWFGKIHALKGFNFKIRPGEAVGLVGDNGAGKSTFAKIVSGAIEKNEGSFYWEGEEVKISSIEDARHLGIETVYQEQALVDELNVAQNIFLGREITQYGPLKALNVDQMNRRSAEVTKKMGLRMEPTQKVKFCSGGEREGIAVARALLFKAKLVILDEPTHALSSKGVEKVLDFIKEMKDKNIGVILISHIFPQIFPVSDRFVILSQGEKVSEKSKEETSPEELSEIIVERS